MHMCSQYGGLTQFRNGCFTYFPQSFVIGIIDLFVISLDFVLFGGDRSVIQFNLLPCVLAFTNIITPIFLQKLLSLP